MVLYFRVYLYASRFCFSHDSQMDAWFAEGMLVSDSEDEDFAPAAPVVQARHGRDAIFRRTRAKHSLAAVSMEELEAVLQSAVDDDKEKDEVCMHQMHESVAV